MRLLLGIILGIALATGGAYVWLGGDACLARCGKGTTCVAGRCEASTPAPTAAPEKVPRERRRRGGPASQAQPEATLQPGDDKMVARGDALGRSEHVDLTQGGEDGKDLDEAELDRVFKPAQPAISRCITDALGDLPLTSGKVEVSFRVEASGVVEKVRLEAPAVLQRRGLHECARRVVRGLKFPRSGGASVVSYPFEIR
jgi:hypothetical protein